MLLSYITVELPLAERHPLRISRFEWSQKRYEHDFGIIRFRDWDIDPQDLIKGSPVKITMTTHESRKSLYGYIHYVSHQKNAINNFTDMYVIGR